MKSLSFVGACLSGFFWAFPTLGRVDGAVSPYRLPIQVRVRLTEATPQVVVRGFDLHVYESQKAGFQLVMTADRTSEWKLRCQDGKIKLIPLHPGQKSRRRNLREPVSIQTPVGFLHYEGYPYRNELRVYSRGMQCEVVNVVELEKYLDGLINSEFSARWNEESIAAQVVAARTYAYYKILEARRKRKLHFDLDASVRDQVYTGALRENFHSSRVAEKTRGLVLVGVEKRPVPIKAFYHSTCGGETELPENVWGVHYPGFKKKVPCPFCMSSPRYDWRLDLPELEVMQLIQQGAKKEGIQAGWPKHAMAGIQGGKLRSIQVNSISELSRVSRVVLNLTFGKILMDVPISGVQFRNWMGVSRFRSTAFQATYLRATQGGKWCFQGRGNGHGVGMCQWGAKVMGERKHNMASILKYYYPDAILKKFW